MSGNNDLILKIKQYLEVDKQIESLNATANELRKKRTILEEQLVNSIRDVSNIMGNGEKKYLKEEMSKFKDQKYW